MRDRPGHIQNITLLFVLIAPLVFLYYGSYVFNPINAGNITLYVLQVLADGIAIINVGTLWLTIMLDILQSNNPKRNLVYHHEWSLSHQLSVDILVPVAREPMPVIQHTIKHAIDLEYPHKVYVLDDGASDEVLRLAREVGAVYIRRPGHEKTYAKSGNLNYGLRFATGDFVAIFDADHAPRKSFLVELLPFFENENVALVQTPQHYVNMDNFIASGTAQAQEVFYKYVQPAKNSYNASFCVGTNMIFRRSALNEIGGIPLRDHSEDIWTSLLLHEKGYESIFYNKVLADGRAPETIPAFFRQQHRWSRGGFIIFFTRNPLFNRKLTLDQRLQYFFSNIHYFTAFSILVYLFVPIIYLLYGIHPMNLMHSQQWLVHYLPYFCVVYFLPLFLLKRLRLATISTSLASFSPYIQSFFSVVLKNNYRWVATEAVNKKSVSTITLIWPHLLIIFLSLSAIVVGWYHVVDVPTTIFTSLWALINSYLLFVFVNKGLASQLATS